MFMPVAKSIHRKMICEMWMAIETPSVSIPKSTIETRTDSANDRLFERIKRKEEEERKRKENEERKTKEN